MGAPVPVRAIAGAAAANYRADGGRSADFVVLASSVAGTAHRLGGGRCEDAYAWVKPRPGRLGLIIADGVSTAGRGGDGADLAVAAAARYLSEREDWGVAECRGAVERASDYLRAAARASGPASAAELSTTLVVALVTTRTDGAVAVMARVGTTPASYWTAEFGVRSSCPRERRPSSRRHRRPAVARPGRERAQYC